jgi:hypothetical protein
MAYLTALRRKVRRRRRRQTLTFLTMVASVVAVGLLAYGYFEGKWAWPGQSTTVASCPPPETEVINPDAVSLRVFNSTDRRGLAATVTRDLQRRGFHVIEVGNGDQKVPADVAAVLRYGVDQEPIARVVAAHMIGKVQLLEDATIESSVITVDLGPKYAQLRPAAQASSLANPTSSYDPNYCHSPSPSSSDEGGSGTPTGSSGVSPSN